MKRRGNDFPVVDVTGVTGKFKAMPLFGMEDFDLVSRKKYQLIREYDYSGAMTVGDFNSVEEAKDALVDLVDTYNSLDLADGDTMVLSEDGMTASTYLHGKADIKEVFIDGANGSSRTA